ncbi:MAG: hypothetical protein OEU92_04040 [Alphaproteobacteria bacterium]|nr:hypothetical protein [Alphaproteobacteria bacterium]
MGDETKAMRADSATVLGDGHRGRVVVCGSHGGVYCGYLAAIAGLRAVILNDAGIGLDQAGVGALDYCQKLGMAAAACAHDSARIGDGKDMAARGRVSRVNRLAADCGCVAGMPVAKAAEHLLTAPHQAWSVRPYREARQVLTSDGRAPSIVCLDSVTLVTEDDVGQIVLTGSHGGLMGGRPEGALKVDASAAFFNDAGVGADRAGLGRLAALDRRGIVAATVDAMSARIGDGLSTFEDGRLSFVNDRASSSGLVAGMTARQAVERLRQQGEV